MVGFWRRWSNKIAGDGAASVFWVEPNSSDMRTTALPLLALAFFPPTPHAERPATSPAYAWRQLTPKAAFNGSYNFDLFATGTHVYAFHPEGVWRSTDGVAWQKTGLPNVLGSQAFADYVQFNGGVYALGTATGNVETYRQTSRIRRTTDFKTWQTLAEASNLPRLVGGSPRSAINSHETAPAFPALPNRPTYLRRMCFRGNAQQRHLARDHPPRHRAGPANPHFGYDIFRPTAKPRRRARCSTPTTPTPPAATPSSAPKTAAATPGGMATCAAGLKPTPTDATKSTPSNPRPTPASGCRRTSTRW